MESSRADRILSPGRTEEVAGRGRQPDEERIYHWRRQVNGRVVLGQTGISPRRNAGSGALVAERSMQQSSARQMTYTMENA